MNINRGDKFYCIKEGYHGTTVGECYIVGATYNDIETGELSQFAIESVDYEYTHPNPIGFRILINTHPELMRKFNDCFIHEREHIRYLREESIKNIIDD